MGRSHVKEDARSKYRTGGAKKPAAAMNRGVRGWPHRSTAWNQGDSPDRVCGRSAASIGESSQVPLVIPSGSVTQSSRIMCARIAKELKFAAPSYAPADHYSFSTVHHRGTRPQVQAQSHSYAIETLRKGGYDPLANFVNSPRPHLQFRMRLKDLSGTNRRYYMGPKASLAVTKQWNKLVTTAPISSSARFELRAVWLLGVWLAGR